MTTLVEALREDAEMLRVGYRPGLSESWHSAVMADAAKDCTKAADTITEALRVVREAREALDRSERVRITACDFIDCHVADPDLTDEMIEAYRRFQNAREAYGQPVREAITAFISQHEGEAP